MPNGDDTRETYTAFLRTVEGIVNHRLNRIESETESQHAEHLTKSVFEALLAPDAVNAVVNAFTSFHESHGSSDWPNGKDEIVREALLAEIQFFNARYVRFRNENDDDGEDGEPDRGADDGEADRGADDSEVVKGSLEKILGPRLPKWIKDLLKLLNEILKLIRPILARS